MAWVSPADRRNWLAGAGTGPPPVNNTLRNFGTESYYYYSIKALISLLLELSDRNHTGTSRARMIILYRS
jgi:hypothetical protein